jgi:protein-S-isoprenylcysteine O-methyltransferase Ste14
MKKTMISIGNFLFKHRNYLFPAYILALFLVFMPPSSEPGTGLMRIIALVLAFAGLAIRAVVIGYAYIKRGGVNKKVYADDLVTGGMFSITRNPLYVGNMLIYAGEFLMFGNLAVFIIGVLSFWFIYECIIAAEENYLRNKFGAQYEAYCKDVPRWALKLDRFPEAKKGMKFNIKRVFQKDYSTMLSTIAVLAAIEFWRLAANGIQSNEQNNFIFLLAAVIVLVIAASLIRFFKKKEAAKRARS